MFYGSLDTEKLLRPLRKYYSADGSMEIKHNIQTGAIEFVTYIGGDGYTAPIVLKSDGTTQNYLYLQRDYQGSIVAISDATGVVVEKRLFDAWGNVLVQDGAGNTLSGLTILDRGYTGHEHLQSVGLIHMNGRLYDAKLHRFLQPDNYVQDPSNTQNYNRYGYVLNNPLKYIDPSGELSFKSIGRWFKRNANDIIAGVQIIGGVILTVTGFPEFGVPLIAAGVTHFGAAYNEYKQTGDWSSASNNAGVFFNVSFKTDFGYNNKDKQNGVNQKTPVVTPKTVEDVKKDKGESGGNSNTILDIGGGIYGALETTATPGDQWLGKNGKYNNNSWGGNQYTGSRAGAFEAASNYKWAGRVALGAGIVISGVKTYNAYQLDGRHIGYNTQYAATSATGGIVGGWAGAEAGATAGAAIGVWFWGAGAVPGAIIGGFIGGFSGGYVGSSIGESSVNYYHNK